MRLLRIEAERYGSLLGGRLGDLGPGLTVVFGPNEAGKTSYTHLVRHILYGFPTPASKGDRPFVSAAGTRQARLVFADDEGGEWSVERVEGPHGGTLSVRDPAGEERSDVVAELTRGVSGDAYKVVFGFGLDELAAIEKDRGDDVIGRLYAASAGLAVSPMDVRSGIDDEAEKLFAPRARSRVVNELHARLKEVRTRVHEAEAAAESFRSDRERLVVLEERLEEARTERSSCHDRLTSLQVAAERIEAADARIDEAEQDLKESRIELRDARALVATLEPDADALDAACAVDAALEELSAFRSKRDEERRRRGEASRAAEEIAELGREGDIDPGTLLAIPVDRSTRAEVEKKADALHAARAQEDAAHAQAAGSSAGAASGTGSDRGRRTGVVLAIVGVVVAGMGVALGDAALPLGLAAGSLVGIVGIWIAWTSRSTGHGMDPAGRSASDAEAVARAEESVRRAEAAWNETVGSLGLPAEAPARVRRLLDAAERASAIDTRRREADAEAERLAAETCAYRDRLLADTAFLGDERTDELDRVPEVAGRAKERVAEARTARAEREKTAADVESLERRIADLEQAEAAARAEALATYGSQGLEEGGSLELLRRLEAEARRSADEADQAYDALTDERGGLAERLDAASRENPAAELRLEESALEEQIARAAERYAVLAVAAELLVRAQERYERERQPEVVRCAQGHLARITDGRYDKVRIPLGEGSIEVVDASGRTVPSERLSRGTAEQLYLALRLGLVERMGEAGAGLPLLMDDVLVNFDPERARGAAEAVADLARSRQVVLFTCHPATLALFEEIDEPTVVRLERC